MVLDGERQVTAQYKHTKLGVSVNIILKIAIVWETIQRTNYEEINVYQLIQLSFFHRLRLLILTGCS